MTKKTTNAKALPSKGLSTSSNETATEKIDRQYKAKLSKKEIEEDEMLNDISQTFGYIVDEFKNGTNDFGKQEQKHAVYTGVLILHSKNYSFYNVLEAAFTWFKSIEPTYILEACTQIYNHPLLKSKK